MSGKKKLIKDGSIVTEVEEDLAFSKTFDVGSHSCTIIQHGEKFELRIDNQVFTHMMDLEKNKFHFGKSSAPTSISITSEMISPQPTRIGFGIANIGHQTKQSKSESSAPMFSFSIKPACNTPNTKKFSETNPVMGFNKQNLDRHSSASSNYNNKSDNIEQHQSTPSSNSNLLDFGNDLLPTSNNQNHHEFKMKMNHSTNINFHGSNNFNNYDQYNQSQSINQNKANFDLMGNNNYQQNDQFASGNK